MNDPKKIGDENLVPLDGLTRELQPPPQLEQRVVDALASRGLLKPRSAGAAWAWRAAAAVLAIGIFFGGFAAGKKGAQQPIAENQPAFILFLHEDANYQQATDEQLPGRIAEYSNWARELRQSGVTISGTKLRDDVHLLLARPDGDAAAQQPADAVAGYFIIHAKSLEEVVAISRKCPHLRYGGRIEIRQVQPV